MMDYTAQDIPQVPDAIVYVINSEVEKVIPFTDAPSGDKGFLVPVKDAEGNITMEYKKTAVVRTSYFDDEKNEVPLKKATMVYKRYYDKDARIIHRPFRVITRTKE